MTAKLKHDIDDIVAQLVANYKPEKIILFGSAARGDATDESDVDIFVVKNTPKRYFDRVAEARKFLPSNCSIDMIVYTPNEFAQSIAERRLFIRQVLKYGKTLYDNQVQSS